MEEIKVSVLCLVYNHEGYLRQALEGFISQKTNFAFEVLIHDDASTDNSAAIIREYEQKYPDIIKPIYQTENQYSKGRKIILNVLLPRVRGKYIAFCEGDDYWIDPDKLQKQYDLLEQHKDVDICAHNAKWVKDGCCIKETHIADANVEHLTLEDVILYTKGYISTASIMMRKCVYEDSNLRTLLEIASFDYVVFICGAVRGGLLCLSDTMSVYRVCTKGSWTERDKQSKGKLLLKHLEKKIIILKTLNDITDYRYEKAIEQAAKSALLRKLKIEGKYAEIRRDKRLYKMLSCSEKIFSWFYIFHMVWLYRSISFVVPKNLKSLFKKIK